MAGLPAGVCAAYKKDKTLYYRASITCQSKHISLGSFTTADVAHAAYLEAGVLLFDRTITLERYQEHHVLQFDKWVILINFRDNGIYIGTPIYIRARFFEYYLAPDYVLTFDRDDLFYYASHKIIRRGGHLFVSDYGMQVNILNRYGIKNYGVEGKDYRFLNGINTDFRYENIEILNCYQGVSIQKKNGRLLYKVKLHLKGNYVVGTYETIEEAAIAYNKAIDIVQKKGVTKNFTPNYLEHISASEYADIYTRIKISPRLLHYQPAIFPHNLQS